MPPPPSITTPPSTTTTKYHQHHRRHRPFLRYDTVALCTVMGLAQPWRVWRRVLCFDAARFLLPVPSALLLVLFFFFKRFLVLVHLDSTGTSHHGTCRASLACTPVSRFLPSSLRLPFTYHQAPPPRKATATTLPPRPSVTTPPSTTTTKYHQYHRGH